MTKDECRVAFEKWYEEEVIVADGSGQTQPFHSAHAIFGEDAWQAWQAAWNRRAEPGAEVVQRVKSAIRKAGVDAHAMNDELFLTKLAIAAIAAMQEPPK